jgi:polyhydroxyalkanoate synthase
VRDLIRRNVLMGGRWRLGGREIDFSATDAAVLNVMAGADRVVPRAASEPVTDLIGRPDRREQLVVPGGHATFGTGRSAFKHTLPSLAAWIGAHSDTSLDTEEAHGDQAHRVG